MKINTDAQAIKEHGFKVYMRKPSDSYMFFTDGKSIGYFQSDKYRPATISTVHKPNGTTGTGFRVVDDADPKNKKDLERGFDFCPNWASGRDRASVIKWRDMAEFLEDNDWNAGYSEV